MASFLYKLGVAALGTTVGSSLASWTIDRWNLTHKEKFGTDGRFHGSRFQVINPPSRLPIHRSHLISRAMQIQNLQRQSEFDVSVIDGGPTGASCALDAVTRDLKTALIEADDVASGTSSKSTKLIERGAQCLQKAATESDYKQCSIVKEVLGENASLLESASHLVHPLRITLPAYEWWQIPFYRMGTKCYDLSAGDRNVKGSYFLSKQDALELFPMLKKDSLVGAIVYYDEQQDDGRMCLAVVVTAARHGATVCNHVEVLRLLKKDDGKGGYVLYGVEVIDHKTGKKFIIKAQCVVNATGSFNDSIRKIDDPTVRSICAPSSCTHIALPGYYSPEQMNLLDPSTSDGRVIFFLPWQMHTNGGTIDTPHEVKDKPAPSDNVLNEIQDVCVNVDADVRHGDVLSARSGIPSSVGTIGTPREVKDKPAPSDNVLNEIQDVCVNVDVDVRDGDVLSVRSGIPFSVGTIGTPHEVEDIPAPSDNVLNEIQDVCVNVDADVRDGDVLSVRSGIPCSVGSEPKKDDTQLWTHSRTIHISPSNLITVAGDKCVATSRALAERAIDTAIEVCDLKPAWSESIRNTLKTEGGQNWSPTMCRRLVQDYGLEFEVAQHLAKLYGDRAFEIAKMASLTGKRRPIAGNRIHPDFPCIDAEVRYGVREYACNAVDMIARRLCLSFLNVQATQESLPKICDIMAEELNWSNEEKKEQMKKAKQYLALEKGQASKRNRAKRRAYLNLSKEQELYTKRLARLDKDERHSRGFKQRFGDCDISDDILKDIDPKVIGEKNFGDYLKIERHC
uniref:glycerol-3-phosphate dehydrogenase n=1 Tax=Glossina austeni TaxID=7395 RepID=A0A1A9V951_GLOAU